MKKVFDSNVMSEVASSVVLSAAFRDVLKMKIFSNPNCFLTIKDYSVF